MTTPTQHLTRDGRPDPLRRVLPLLEVRPAKVAAAIGLGVLALGCAIGLAAVAAWLVARAAQMPPVLTLSVAVVAVRAFGIGRGVLRYCERLASHDVALRGMAALRANLYDRLAADDRPVTVRRGELLARIGQDVDDVGDVVVRSIVPAGVAVVTSLGSVILVGVLLPAAGAALALCLVLAGVVTPWLAARAAARTEARGAAARGEVTALSLEILEESAPLRVSGRFGARLADLDAADAHLSAVADDGARTSGLAAALGALAQGLAVLASVALGIPATLSGSLSVEALSVIVLTPLAVFEATAGLPAAAVQLHRSRAAADRLVELLPDADPVPGAPPARVAPASAASVEREADGAAEGEADGEALLVLDDIAAGWSEGAGPPRTVVEGVSLTLRPGSVVALAGPSGVGKTTLLMTAAALIPPRAGQVSGWSAERQEVGIPSDRSADLLPTAQGAPEARLFVAEDGHVFDTSVVENLRVARGDVTAAEARDALDAVGLGDWLAALPDGLDTVVGTDAAAVSGGERRRLLVARALLSPARVLLVDEPAEHLDGRTADALVRALADHARETGRAVLLATHRLTPLAAADEVLLLGHDALAAPDAPATVTARGAHEHLRAHDPEYTWSAAQEQSS
ncbi:thiol reductant ABC exporter subunit CydC [Promicromonospora iranensis]|uniref:ATP-binding cassette subfamily C protein CydC n=1 Tax=Promicromonospora iranensis TaxID=1105144 RepID=A0ABU2CT00_9MICO|nr:thiol reductant ABC exporter subunit CydC [Promicromonospora iranensis]MDR7384468.1 ATP-binding cassette subfamily C protein CydC [Promicromonospora iranensis]